MIILSEIKKKPQRQCIGCRQMKDKKSLIRIIKSDEGMMIDVTGKKNGRGAYVCPNRECIEKAIKTKGLDRSFGQSVDKNVYESLIRSLEEIESR